MKDRNKAAKSGSSLPPCSEWIPASTPPPMGTWNVIVKGGNYMISEAIYMREPVPMMSGATKPPGFYLNMGGGNILDAEWVEWWIPMPSLPNAER